MISGNCTIGDYCFIGVNATFRDGITIAPRCIIGAGAVIMRDTDEGDVFAVPEHAAVSEAQLGAGRVLMGARWHKQGLLLDGAARPAVVGVARRAADDRRGTVGRTAPRGRPVRRHARSPTGARGSPAPSSISAASARASPRSTPSRCWRRARSAPSTTRA